MLNIFPTQRKLVTTSDMTKSMKIFELLINAVVNLQSASVYYTSFYLVVVSN
jgi:hypothetical protein